MTSETLRIMCPALSCRKILAVPASSRGKNVRCKNCGATIHIPERPPAPAPAPAPSNAAAQEKAGDKQQPKPAQAA